MKVSVLIADASSRFGYSQTLEGLNYRQDKYSGGVRFLINACRPKHPSALPWGFARSLEFRKFTQASLTIASSCRPLAAKLEELEYLRCLSPAAGRETQPPPV